MYKSLYEMHCHTDESSRCGKVPAADLVEMYIGAGYDGIVITDHFQFYSKDEMSVSEYNAKADKLKQGYEAALKAAGGRINILRGAEFHLYDSDNDYLLYNVTDEFIRGNPELRNMNIKQFSELTHRLGMPLFQAHPMRNSMTIVNPELLDGIEVNNGNMRHDSRNNIARLWAEKFGLRVVSGSDFHEPEDLARGGIYFNEKITDGESLVTALLTGEYELKLVSED